MEKEPSQLLPGECKANSQFTEPISLQFTEFNMHSVCLQFTGHVTTVSPLGKPQKFSQFTEPLTQSVFFHFAEQFNHSLLDPVNSKKNPNWFTDDVPG